MHLRVSCSQRGILTNNGPSWQTIQGCGARLKKQQITQAPGPPGRGAGVKLESHSEGLHGDPQEMMGHTRKVIPLGLQPGSVLSDSGGEGRVLFPSSFPLQPLRPACLLRPPKGLGGLSRTSAAMLIPSMCQVVTPRLGATTPYNATSHTHPSPGQVPDPFRFQAETQEYLRKSTGKSPGCDFGAICLQILSLSRV